jgi:oxygen-independent coproporphyrinogen-3 oxidase
MLAAAGYAHYEVSNYAKGGRVAAHNSAYWQDRPYVGLGPSAHGFDGLARRWNEPVYARWLVRVNSGEDPIGGSETLTSEQRAAERVYLGLRTDRGLEVSDADLEVITPWINAGWGQIRERHESRILVLTPPGWMRLDALATSLTSFRSRY